MPAVPERQSAVEEVQISSDDIASLGEGESITLVLDDGVIYLIEPEIPLERISVIIGGSTLTLPELVSRLGASIEPGEEIALGTDESMSDWREGGELMRPKGGCWWEIIDGQWAYLCLA